MGLTAEQLKAREGRLTASAVACLMTGNKRKILDLWRSLIGDPTYQAPDLSGVWPVRLGEVTEELQLDWYERKTGHQVGRRGEVVIHPDHQWAAATLDGYDIQLNAPIECKHVGGREPLDRILVRYKPQCFWQMIVTKTKTTLMSVIEAANEPIIVPVHYETEYAAELWRRAEIFMGHVANMTPPIEVIDKA